MTDFYTYRSDLRAGGNGSPAGYRYDATAFTTTGDIEQGEFTAWDTTNKRIVRFVRDSSAGKFVGISRDSAKGMKRLGNQAALTLTELSVFGSGIHDLVGKSGETYNHGDPVYMDATSTIAITKTAAGGTQIGTVFNPQNRTITGNVRVPVLIDEFVVTPA
jgi:hypothetical protein